ncbi:MAG: ATP-binding cassette domain-containing protein, partial [Bacillota bacterium]
MQHNLSQVTVRSLGFDFPQGKTLFSNLSFTLGAHCYALVGPNGVGKSTLAKVLAGLEKATRGQVLIPGGVVYLEQREERVEISGTQYLQNLWESCFADPAMWGPLLDGINLDSAVANLSGGEWARVRIAKSLAKPAGLLILDEPTNNLDKKARELIYGFIGNYKEPLLIISHDRELLEKVDQILELSNQGLSSYGGNYTFYQKQKTAAKELEVETLDRLRREKKKSEREIHERMAAQDKRMRRGSEQSARGGMPKILLGSRKRQAQVTQGKINIREEKSVERAQQNFSHFYRHMKQESQLGFEFPNTSVPSGKTILKLEEFNFSFANVKLWKENLNWHMQGPARWALAGKNGVGKSTLIDLILSAGRKPTGHTYGTLQKGELSISLLDQEYSILDFE